MHNKYKQPPCATTARFPGGHDPGLPPSSFSRAKAVAYFVT